MEPIISKEELERLMAIKGEVRGLALKSHGDFIMKEKGEQGLRRLEETLEDLGCAINHKEIEAMRFYPIYLEVIALVVIRRLFNFGDEKFIEIGEFGSKLSLIIRLFMKYFISIKLMAKQTPRIWGKYYTIGSLKMSGLDEVKKQLVLRLEDFNLHPLHCLHLQGYFSNVVKMVTKSPVSSEERKCIHRGDECHEFLLKW